MHSILQVILRILPKHRLILHISLTLLTLLLLSITLSLTFGTYELTQEYLGKVKHTLLVYDTKARTPITGLVPLELTDPIKKLKGVLVVSPEVYVPCTLLGKPVIVHGVNIKEYAKLFEIKLIKGRMLNETSTYQALINHELARLLNLKVNDKLIIASTVTSHWVIAEVVGVYEVKDQPRILEVLAPLQLAQYLRGHTNSVTVIRVKYDPNVVSEKVLIKQIKNIPLGERPKPQKPTIIKAVKEKVGVAVPERVVETYVRRYFGFTEGTLASVIIVTIIASIVILYSSTSRLILEPLDRIGYLIALGFKPRKLTTYIAEILILIIVFTSIICYITLFTLASIGIGIISLVNPNYTLISLLPVTTVTLVTLIIKRKNITHAVTYATKLE